MAKKSTPEKPKKPRPSFPLTPHRTGQWCKKIRGRIFYFGRDAAEAEARYNREREYLEQGLPVPAFVEGDATLADVANRYLTALEASVTTHHFAQSKDALAAFVKAVGRERDPGSLAPDDFRRARAALAKRNDGQPVAPATLRKRLGIVRTMFRWAEAEGVIDRQPRFGADFKAPGQREERLYASRRPAKSLGRETILAMLKTTADRPALRAMILLAVQSGMGNGDCCQLLKTQVDLDGGWIRCPRRKTGIDRRIPLWPETVDALRLAMEHDAEAALQTKYGGPWTTEGVAHEIAKLLVSLDAKASGVGLYALRHVFQTVAEDATGDFSAIRHIMGHAPSASDMASRYRLGFADDRLRRVVEAVRDWLGPQNAAQAKNLSSDISDQIVPPVA